MLFQHKASQRKYLPYSVSPNHVITKMSWRHFQRMTKQNQFSAVFDSKYPICHFKINKLFSDCQVLSSHQMWTQIQPKINKKNKDIHSEKKNITFHRLSPFYFYIMTKKYENQSNFQESRPEIREEEISWQTGLYLSLARKV